MKTKYLTICIITEEKQFGYIQMNESQIDFKNLKEFSIEEIEEINKMLERYLIAAKQFKESSDS